MDKNLDVVKCLHHQIEDHTEMKIMLHQARFQADAAQIIYDARTQAGLSQTQLAIQSGLSEETVNAIEEADYDGDLLQVINRIAGVLNLRLNLSLKPIQESTPVSV